MATVRRDGDAVTVSLSGDETGLLTSLATQVTEMLAPPDDASPGRGDADPLEDIVGMSPTPVAQSDDPAVRRLLPDAYTEEAEASEFRRLMDSELRGTKTAALRRLLDDVGSAGPVTLGPAEAEQWLHALTDLRLVVGTRLEITDDEDALRRRVPPRDPRFPLFVAYDWLSALQDRLVNVVMGEE